MVYPDERVAALRNRTELAQTRLAKVQRNLEKFLQALNKPGVKVESKLFYDTDKLLKSIAKRSYPLIYLTEDLQV